MMSGVPLEKRWAFKNFGIINSITKLHLVGISTEQVCICVVRLLFVLFYVVFVCKCVQPPGDNPIAVNKYITSNNYNTLTQISVQIEEFVLCALNTNKDIKKWPIVDIC
jgi:hypothetical protein